MTEQKATGPRRLTRDDWITAALGAIADGGLAAVGIEPLAARLGTTKGSFYWHFENRGALLDAAIRRWEKETTTDVAAEITAAHDAPASQFRSLAAAVIERAEHDRVGPALLASATHPAVAPALERITAARLSLIATVLRRLGFPRPRPAAARSWLTAPTSATASSPTQHPASCPRPGPGGAHTSRTPSVP
jgi:AcrR family transcriptional regulator